MAGKKKGPTKAVAKKSIKLKIDNELLDTLTKSSEVTQEPKDVNGIANVEVHSESDISNTNSKETNSKKNTKKGQNKMQKLKFLMINRLQ